MAATATWRSEGRVSRGSVWSTRTFSHGGSVSKPLRRQMRVEIDRGRWPVLITYSDEGQGHTGHCDSVRARLEAQVLGVAAYGP